MPIMRAPGPMTPVEMARRLERMRIELVAIAGGIEVLQDELTATLRTPELEVGTLVHWRKSVREGWNAGEIVEGPLPSRRAADPDEVKLWRVHSPGLGTHVVPGHLIRVYDSSEDDGGGQ